MGLVADYTNIDIFQWNKLYKAVRWHICLLYFGYRQKYSSQNVVNFDFQGVEELFIHEVSGDWSQIMSKIDFSSEISTMSADFDRKH